MKYLFGGRYTDFWFGLGMIVEGERGNKDDDRFSGLINEWMVAPYDEMVKVPLFKVVEDKA